MKKIKTFVVVLILATLLVPMGVHAVTIGDYTAFPPFLPRIVDPNIIMLLDFSKHTVRPAYGLYTPGYYNDQTTFLSLQNNYLIQNNDGVAAPEKKYEGIYSPTSKYDCAQGGACEIVPDSTADAWNGNWLNWLTMTQFNIVKQVAAGGEIFPAPETASPGDLDGYTATLAGNKFVKFVPQSQCRENAPDFLCDLPMDWWWGGYFPYRWIEPQGAATVTTVWENVNEPGGVRKGVLPDGFRFKFYDRQFTGGETFVVNVNGWMSFTVDSASIPTNAGLPTSTIHDYTLMPYWTNQALQSHNLRPSSVKYFSNGSAPNRTFVMTFTNMVDEDGDRNSDKKPLTYQLVLFENTDIVVFNYKETQSESIGNWIPGIPGYYDGFGAGVNATIGVQGVGADGEAEMLVGDYNTYQIEDSMSALFTLGEDYVAFEMTTRAGNHVSTGFQPAFPDWANMTGDEWASYTELGLLGASYDAHTLIKKIVAYTTEATCFEQGYDWNTSNNTCYDHPVNGLLQYFRENDLGGTLGFRLGFMMLQDDGDGGVMHKHIGEFESNTTHDATTGNKTDKGNPNAGSLGDKDAQWSTLMNKVRPAAPTADAPLAEALFEVQAYLREDPAFKISKGVNTSDGVDGPCQKGSNTYDPYCFTDSAQKVPCAKSFVLLVSGGYYSHDNGTSIFAASDPLATAFDGSTGVATAETGWEGGFVSWLAGVKSTDDSAAEWTKANGGWLDNVAYNTHSEDLRDENATGLAEADKLVENQVLSLYAVDVYAEEFGAGTAVMKKAAAWGGYKETTDLSSATYLDDPTTYFSAGDGSGVKGAILDAVFEILKNSSSGTSVSVLSTSAGGEGALYQAYFYPAKVLKNVNYGESEERQWPGYMRAFYIDRYQNMRDDFSYANTTAIDPEDNAAKNARLELALDRIVQMGMGSEDKVEINLFKDADGDGVLSDAEKNSGPVNASPIDIDSVSSLWEGGESLAKQDRSKRNIYVWVDRENDGKTPVDGEGDFGSAANTFTGETLRLNTSMAAGLAPYFRANDSVLLDALGDPVTTAEEESNNLIRFITGHEIYNSASDNGQQFRTRCMWVSDQKRLPNVSKAVPTYDPVTSNDHGCAQTAAEKDRIPAGKISVDWPLGDIVFSTPTLVSGPSENYDKIYNYSTYPAFKKKYTHRRNVIYVGANDGMLHAFNGGIFNEGDPEPGLNSEVQAYFESGTSDETNTTNEYLRNKALGEELWAFLPYDLLPHMSWLTCNGSNKDAYSCQTSEYTHVYYVDNRAKVTDVQIFNNMDSSDPSLNYSDGIYTIDGQAGDGVHPNGWGTILIMSMRLGGGAMDLADLGDSKGPRAFRSAYYALDITDPEKPPKLLWRWTDADLGFSTSYPSIVRVKDSATGLVSWFMVVGSGPTNQIPGGGIRDYSFKSSTSEGSIFAVNLVTGVGTKIPDTDNVMSGAEIMGDPTVIDVNRDFSADVIYIGSTIPQTSPRAGKLYRIQTKKSDDPADWAISKFFSDAALGPMLVGVSASMDKKENLWIYFGTGQLRNRDDMDNSDQQRFYAIKDKCWDGELTATNPSPCKTTYTVAAGASSGLGLVNTTDVVVKELSASVSSATQVTAPANSVCGAAAGSCSYSEVLTKISSQQGWYFNLWTDGTDPSERVLSKSSVLGGLLLFTTYKPNTDTCSIFGSSNLYSLYYETGTAFKKPTIGVDETTGEILSSIDIGEGMPTSIGVAIGETVSGFVQKSTGEIKTIESEPAIKVKSGPSSWRVEPTGGGTTGIETIYKHIAK